MTTSITTTIGNLFQNIGNNVVALSSEWYGRIVTKIKSAATHLQEPRMASAFIFFSNFGILELSYRIAQVMTWILPKETDVQVFVKRSFQAVIIIGLTTAANVGLLQATGITLNPLVVVAVVITSCMVKYNLHAFLDD